MGKLKVMGVDILERTTPEDKDEVGTAHSAFGRKIRGLNAEVDNGTKKIITGWFCYNNNDAALSKLKVNGVVAPVMEDGTRPRNLHEYFEEGTGKTKYLNNIDGKLYLSDNENSATGSHITTSRSRNKKCIVNIAAWGAGGKGGNGAYIFLKGNWGGIGGAGGGKVFFSANISNNTSVKIVTDKDDEKNGRVNCSESGDDYESPGITITCGNVFRVTCSGGRSGVGLHGRDGHNDKGGGGGSVTSNSETFFYSAIPIRKKADGGNKNTSHGRNGNSSEFTDKDSPYLGNPEDNKGSLVLTGEGGKSPDSDNQGYGSGGGGSYGNGGKSADTDGNGSTGENGSRGGGGGGAGSPAGGANGGDGGLPGFIVYY